VNATHDETERPTTQSLGTMRAEATWFLDQHHLLGRNSVRQFGEDFRRFLEEVIPRIEQLAARRRGDDVPAQVALAAGEEARRRLAEPEAGELNGEVARASRLARSAVALCDHHDALTGTLVCLVCDQGISDGEVSLPYGQFRSGESAGRVHARCTGTLRRRRSAVAGQQDSSM
jgi:hypothetical protein